MPLEILRSNNIFLTLQFTRQVSSCVSHQPVTSLLFILFRNMQLLLQATRNEL